MELDSERGGQNLTVSTSVTGFDIQWGLLEPNCGTQKGESLGHGEKEARVGGWVGAQDGGAVSTVLGGKEEKLVIDAGRRVGAATRNRVFTE